MFDFSWSEILVIGIVALVAIGPKDMPVALRAMGRAVRAMRRMAGEFQGHLDEMLREADLQDVSSTLRDIRGMGVGNAVSRFVDPDGAVQRALREPFEAHPVPPAPTPTMRRPGDVDVPPRDTPPPDWVMTERAAAAPAFIPPELVAGDVPAVPVGAHAPPAFVPPAFVPPADAAAANAPTAGAAREAAGARAAHDAAGGAPAEDV